MRLDILTTPVAAADGYAGAAWQIAWIIAILLFLLLLQILVMRAVLAARRSRESRFRALWEPLLAQCVEEVPSGLPVLDRRDVPVFLRIWNHLQESLRDAATERLDSLARRVGADDEALRLIRRHGVRDRLIAITALGHLGDYRAWNELIELAASADAVLSLAAARALMRIDAVRAAAHAIPRIGGRSDWPTATVAAMLAEAGPDAVSGPLAAAVEAAAPGEAPRLIRLLEFAHPDVAGPIVRRMLVEDAPVETAIACLRVADDPALLDRIRILARHSRWQVRLHAVQALGRLGTRADESLLIEALSDPEWWVRYRAARALVALPLIEAVHVERLAESLDDRFGRDMLRQVMAEKELAC